MDAPISGPPASADPATTPAGHRRENRPRLAEIDLLRGYAVGFVACLHFNLLNPLPTLISRGMTALTDMGVGVDMFFVISGFVISLSLSSLWDVRSRDLAYELRDVPLTFYRKRFVRLWPAAALWLTINFALSIVFAGYAAWPPVYETFGKLASGLVYLYNFQEAHWNSALGYFWSLSVEWQYYLFVPVFLLVVYNTWLRVLIPFLLVALFAWVQPAGDLWWLFRFDGMPFGMLIYVLLYRLRLSIPRYDSQRSPWLRQAFTLVMLLAIAMLPAVSPSRHLGYLFADGLSAVLVACASLGRGYIGTFGLRPVVAWIGSRSYSIYLVHIPCAMTVISILQWLEARHAALPGETVLRTIYYVGAILLTAMAAEATYRLVEVPSHRASRAIPLLARPEQTARPAATGE